MLRRYGHVAVTWNNATLLWGGLDNNNRVIDTSVVHINLNGKWMEKNTSGDTPTESVYASATMMDGKMFVVGGFTSLERVRNENCIYVLDLATWVWEKLNPYGHGPYPGRTSWPYPGRTKERFMYLI